MFDINTHVQAHSVDEAIQLLNENPQARLLAGGTDVLIKLRHGRREFCDLVDINGLKELRYIQLDEDHTIRIGSGVVFNDLIASDIIKTHVPMLKDASESVGGPQIRNVATIGGNICNGVTSADSASSLFVLDALLQLRSDKGKREIPIADFYLGPGKVDLKPGEILTGIKITPENYLEYAGFYFKYAMRNAMDIATIGCAVNLKADRQHLMDFRIAYGVAGPVPMRCPKTEAFAAKKAITNTLMQEISNHVVMDVNPRTSWRATREFRINIIKELSIRTTRRALKRAGEEI